MVSVVHRLLIIALRVAGPLLLRIGATLAISLRSRPLTVGVLNVVLFTPTVLLGLLLAVTDVHYFTPDGALRNPSQFSGTHCHWSK